METEILYTDILIIGGGTAGCYAALTISESSPDTKVIIAEKANIKRSGCLAAGVNALNAYITKGHDASFYADYAISDAHGIASRELLLSMSENLNECAKELENLGLVFLKDENDEYVARGDRNIKIRGENIKPLLADAVNARPNVAVINRLNIIDYITDGENVIGAFGNKIDREKLVFIGAKAVIICTGGASGIYSPTNPGMSRHKTWYCPFNAGSGYAMGIRAGAEMTTFEMRFIALRCKDTIAPTGTLAQGVGAKQINSLGEVYENKYGLTTSQRVWGTVSENVLGRGPCYLKTAGITEEQTRDLEKAYLNMSPSQTLKWIESKEPPDKANVQIEGTEPYITGGHTGSGYRVFKDRSTTVKNLFAAGDVAGGCPQKYVTGALSEGKIAALSALSNIKNAKTTEIPGSFIKGAQKRILNIMSGEGALSIRELEENMQSVMDKYAGGRSSYYAYTEESLDIAKEKIKELFNKVDLIRCRNFKELTYYFETLDRLTVSLVLTEHLKARKETRWHCFAENKSYPFKDDENYLKFINSVYKDGEIKIIERPLDYERKD